LLTHQYVIILSSDLCKCFVKFIWLLLHIQRYISLSFSQKNCLQTAIFTSLDWM
jgi:hypothetical protein